MANIIGIATTVVSVIEGVLPVLSSLAPGNVSSIINLISTILPIALQEATDLVAPIQNIIAALKGDGSLTAEELTTLENLDAQCDAAFEAAAKEDGV